MAIYITETAAQNALTQEAEFYPDNQPPLSSELFRRNRTLNRINMGKGASLALDRENNEEAVRLLNIALFTVVQEIPGITPAELTNARNLKWGPADVDGGFVGTFAEITKLSVEVFQQNTPELAAIADGIVGRKTIFELDKALNRIGGYDAINGGTIINYGESEYIGKDTVVYNTPSGVNYVRLFEEPIVNASQEIVRLKEGDIIHVLRKHPSTADGWYQVVVVSASKHTQTPEGEAELLRAFKDNISIEGHIQAAYIWEHWEEGPNGEYRAPMPDVHSKLYRIPARPTTQTPLNFTNTQLKAIIQEHYYDEVKIFPQNADGEIFDPNDPDNPNASPADIIRFPSKGTLIEDMPFFKFCLNLLIYANNPDPEGDLQTDTTRSIYPLPGKSFFKEVDHRSAYDSLETYLQANQNPVDLYDTFLQYVTGIDSKYDYIHEDEPVDEKIQVNLNANGNHYMWIPSRQCAESLWRIVNREYLDALDSGDPVVELAEFAIETLFPRRSEGRRFKIQLGATYAFIGADFEGDVSIWRKDTDTIGDHILKISAFGELKVGADVGVEAGFGFWFGGNNRKRKKDGIRAAVGASAQGGGAVNALIEFEIPVTGNDPLSRGLASMMYTGAGVVLPVIAPFAFYRAAQNFNVDLWNYMTKLKVYTGAYAEAGAEASAGLSFGNSDDQNAWANNNVDEKFTKPTKLASLLSGAAISGGIGIGGNFGFGFDIDVNYFVGSDYSKCMRTDGTRVPLEIKMFAFGEGSIHAEFFTSIAKGLFGFPILPGFALNQGLGMKLGLIYNISDEPDVIDNDTSTFDFTFQKMIRNSKKLISFYNFSGDLDRYLEYGYETTYNFDLSGTVDAITGGFSDSALKIGNYANTTSFKFGESLQDILDNLDGVEFRKRFNFAYASRKLRSIKRSQRIVGNRWIGAKTKFMNAARGVGGFSLASFLDLDYKIAGQDYIEGIKALIIMTRISIAQLELDSQDIPEVALLQDRLVTFNEFDAVDDRIAYALTLYNDTALTPILDANAGVAAVFSKLLKMTAAEIGNRTGFYSGDGDSFSNMDPEIKKMLIAIAMNYVSKWEDIRLSIHNELTFGVGISGSLGLGAKVRGFLGIEAGLVMHSDLIDNDYVYDNYWADLLKSLFDVNPTALPSGEILSTKDKETLVGFLFDKQL